jgi:hypothetical protein
MMERLDEFEDSRNRADRQTSDAARSDPRPVRTHRWIGVALGAILGLMLGSIISSLSAAYLPEGSEWFATSGLLFQIVGAAGGGLIGALASRRR